MGILDAPRGVVSVRFVGVVSGVFSLLDGRWYGVGALIGGGGSGFVEDERLSFVGFCAGSLTPLAE